LQGSPLIDKGSANIQGIWFDYFNHPRPYGAKNDIGAVEFNPLYAVEPGMASGAFMADVWPNPFSGLVTISYQNSGNAEVYLEICDLSGKRILSGSKRNKAAEESLFKMDLSDLPPGLYVYILHSKQGRTAGRIMKF
jgi:hypothetical protein